MTRRSDSVTIRDVAKYAAVSVATISRFLNQTAPVSQEVAERIQQVMLDLNYKPHAAARHLATRRTQTIGLVLHNGLDAFKAITTFLYYLYGGMLLQVFFYNHPGQRFIIYNNGLFHYVLFLRLGLLYG